MYLVLNARTHANERFDDLEAATDYAREQLADSRALNGLVNPASRIPTSYVVWDAALVRPVAFVSAA